MNISKYMHLLYENKKKKKTGKIKGNIGLQPRSLN